MATTTTGHDRHGLPALDPGLALLRLPRPRSPALPALVADRLRRRPGSAFWIDARNHAATYALYGAAPAERTLDSLRIARAFTAYQHHSLVRRLPGLVTGRTSLVVAPAVTALYRDPDLDADRAEHLLDATLAVLSNLASAVDVPVLVTTTAEDPAADSLAVAADTELACRETPFGFAFSGESFETTCYWDGGYWQTTIPYWVALFGAVDTGTEIGVGPLDPVDAPLGWVEG
ncbi:hypothetical protein [Natronorarus salvus]|uniref:hypothetical protein n=1 Tax=Natronorarus salvus TaxID=3117733 RepID=UPI002F266C14